MPHARFADILRLLGTNEVDFIVVGMTAGILHGAPVTTVDLDVVHRRSRDNVARLLRVLAEAKERAGRPNDLAALPVLRATLDEVMRRP